MIRFTKTCKICFRNVVKWHDQEWPDLNPIRPCSVKNAGALTWIFWHWCQKLTWIQRYNCMQSCCYWLIWDYTAFWIRKTEKCPAAPSEHLNVATRHKEALTGQKMLRCWPTLCGLWAPPFCGGPCCWPNMLNMPKCASATPKQEMIRFGGDRD